MTPPGSRFRRRLTDDELGRIRDAVKADGSEAGFRALWEILLGVPWETANQWATKVDVRDYAIPADQDREIQRLLSVPPSRAGRKRWSRRTTGMNFFMFGPATYE